DRARTRGADVRDGVLRRGAQRDDAARGDRSRATEATAAVDDDVVARARDGEHRSHDVRDVVDVAGRVTVADGQTPQADSKALQRGEERFVLQPRELLVLDERHDEARAIDVAQPRDVFVEIAIPTAADV